VSKFDGSSTISSHYKQFLWRFGFQLLSGQQTKNWKEWHFWLIFASTGVNVCCFGSNAGLAATSDPSRMNIQLTSFKLTNNMPESQPQYLESKAVANIQQLLPQTQSFPSQKLGSQTPRTIPSSMETAAPNCPAARELLSYTKCPQNSSPDWVISNSSQHKENSALHYRKPSPGNLGVNAGCLSNSCDGEPQNQPQNHQPQYHQPQKAIADNALSQLPNAIAQSSTSAITTRVSTTVTSKSLDFLRNQENRSGNISLPQSHLKFPIQNVAQISGFIPGDNLKPQIQNPKLIDWVFKKKPHLSSPLSTTPLSLPTIAQPTPATPPEVSPNPPGGAEPPQLESQPNILPTPTPTPIQQPLPAPLINGDPELGILKLQPKINLTPFPDQGDVELGNLHLRTKPRELGNLVVRSQPDELGIIRARPLRTPPEVPPPQMEPPQRRPQPVAYLLARSSYFWTNNIFSSVDPVDDGLIWTGLTLAAAPIRLGPQTFVNLSADGSIIRYIDQSLFNYNQLRFNAGLYQQLSSRMFGEIGWNNQQLFTAQTGDRFLNENSFRLLVGRRDFFSRRLVLDSFYEFRLTFADPLSRSRLINSLWLSLSYYLQSTWQVGLDYQFSLSNFTQREREDQLHRLMARLTYQTSPNTNVTLQGGWSLGGSTEPSIDFNSLFFSVTFSLELGRF
jgi:hypothetical protein